MNTESMPTEVAVISSPWLDGSTAPKDGTEIVAIGRVIYSDDCTTCVDSFVAKIKWWAEPNEGWHYDSGMSVANMLGDEVRVDYWLPMPSNAEICHADPTSGVTMKKTANGSALASSKG